MLWIGRPTSLLLRFVEGAPLRGWHQGDKRHRQGTAPVKKQPRGGHGALQQHSPKKKMWSGYALQEFLALAESNQPVPAHPNGPQILAETRQKAYSYELSNVGNAKAVLRQFWSTLRGGTQLPTPSVRMVGSAHSPRFIAHLEIPVPGNFVAVGVQSKKAEAESRCYLHAACILHALGHAPALPSASPQSYASSPSSPVAPQLPQPPPPPGPGATTQDHLAYMKAYQEYTEKLKAAKAADSGSASPPPPAAQGGKSWHSNSAGYKGQKGGWSNGAKGAVPGASVVPLTSGTSIRPVSGAGAAPPPPQPPPKPQPTPSLYPRVPPDTSINKVQLFSTLCDLPPPNVQYYPFSNAHRFEVTITIPQNGNMVVSGVGEHTTKKGAEAVCYHDVCMKLKQQCPLFRDFEENLYRASVGDLDPSSLMSLWLPQNLQSQVDEICRNDYSGPPGAPPQPIAAAEALQLLRPELIDPAYQERRSMELVAASKAMRNNPKYQKFAEFQATLPTYSHRQEILETIRQNSVVLICGDTGSGKSTQIPQYILDDAIQRGEGGRTNLIVTQPRRLTCVSLARRIAEERCDFIGDNIGYCIRLESRVGKTMNFVTCGVLLRALNTSEKLAGISHLILDEVHERDINSDFLLILIKDLLIIRPDLKVVLMSATMNARLFSQYFNNCPVIDIPGRLYPVQNYFLDDIAPLAKREKPHHHFLSLQMMGMSKRSQPPQHQQQRIHGGKRGRSDNNDDEEDDFEPPTHGFEHDEEPIDYDLIAFLCNYLVNHPESGFRHGGSILVFLPGWQELMTAQGVIESGQFGDPSCYEVHVLHSSIQQQEQNTVFDHAKEGKTKLILSTNICESGVTIDDVSAVIDSGKLKEKSYGQRGAESLWEQLVCIQASKANCKQRSGRAGRTHNGLCYRLFTKRQYEEMADYQTPELLRSPLDSLSLQVMALGLGDPVQFLSKALESPPVEQARQALERLKALSVCIPDENGRPVLTQLGHRLSHLPLTPRMGKMLLVSCVLGCLDSILTVAAASGMDPFITSPFMRKQVNTQRIWLSNRSLSDAIAVINAYNGWITAKLQGQEYPFCERFCLHPPTLNTISKVKKQLYLILLRCGWLGNDDTSMNTARDCFVETGPMSQQSANCGLVKCALAVGLYPNVAVHVEKATFRRRNMRLLCHPRSVLKREKEFGNKWFLFEEQVVSLSKQQYIRGITNLSPFSIILMGASNSSCEFISQLSLLVVDRWMMFKCPHDIVNKVRALKYSISDAMMLRFADPNNEQNNRRLQMITDLLASLSVLPLRPSHSTLVQDPNKRQSKNLRVSETGFQRIEMGSIDPPNLKRPLPQEEMDDVLTQRIVAPPSGDTDCSVDAMGSGGGESAWGSGWGAPASASEGLSTKSWTAPGSWGAGGGGGMQPSA